MPIICSNSAFFIICGKIFIFAQSVESNYGTEYQAKADRDNRSPG
jgi:hypothetical protein